MQVTAYLNFNGRCEEAIQFYREALGAEEVMMMRFGDMPPSEMQKPTPGTENKIMHARFRVGDTTIMASDGRMQGQPMFQGITLAISVAKVDDAKRRFNALAAGGQVQMPLTQTFFSPSFGMLTDRFGVAWMILVEQK